jgi:hypothetical protein
MTRVRCCARSCAFVHGVSVGFLVGSLAAPIETSIMLAAGRKPEVTRHRTSPRDCPQTLLRLGQNSFHHARRRLCRHDATEAETSPVQ